MRPTSLATAGGTASRFWAGFAALQKALDAAQSQRDAAQSERDSLAGENRFLRVQRDLLQEKLNKMMRKVFAASSEVMGTHQKDMFFN